MKIGVSCIQYVYIFLDDFIGWNLWRKGFWNGGKKYEDL